MNTCEIEMGNFLFLIDLLLYRVVYVYHATQVRVGWSFTNKWLLLYLKRCVRGSVCTVHADNTVFFEAFLPTFYTYSSLPRAHETNHV